MPYYDYTTGQMTPREQQKARQRAAVSFWLGAIGGVVRTGVAAYRASSPGSGVSAGDAVDTGVGEFGRTVGNYYAWKDGADPSGAVDRAAPGGYGPAGGGGGLLLLILLGAVLLR